ncbi:MAG: hypothetical protein H6757_02715 [Candidatus Omnitrophica bacterium]|nr:hypothetical protein [Candidatus Omnitrophota bacterium]
MRIIAKFLFTLVIVAAILFAVVYVAGAQVLSGVLSSSLGVPVKVGRIHLASDSLGIYGFEIKNPKGFGESTLAKVPEFSIRFQIKDILNRKVHIEDIRLDFEKIVVERNAEGLVNLLQLKPVKDMLEGSPEQDKPAETDSEQPAKKPETSQPSLELQIDQVVFSLGTAKYIDRSSGENNVVVKEFPLGVEHAELHDVTNPKDIVYQIVLKVMQKIGLNALMPDLNQWSMAFKVQAKEGITKIKEGVGGLLQKFNS